MYFSISGAEPSHPTSKVAAGFLGEWWTWRGQLPLCEAFPLHRKTALQPCGATSHQLHVGITAEMKPRLWNVLHFSGTSPRPSIGMKMVPSFLFCRFNAFHADSNKPLHRECGFIRMQPETNRVAFIIAQNSGRFKTTKPDFVSVISAVSDCRVAFKAWYYPEGTVLHSDLQNVFHIKCDMSHLTSRSLLKDVPHKDGYVKDIGPSPPDL